MTTEKWKIVLFIDNYAAYIVPEMEKLKNYISPSKHNFN